MKKLIALLTLANGLALVPLATQAAVVEFTAAEGYVNGTLLLTYTNDWTAQDGWVIDSSIGDGAVKTLAGDFIRGTYLGVVSSNNIDDKLTATATFQMIGNYHAPSGGFGDAWRQTMLAVDITDQVVAAPAGAATVGVARNGAAELELRVPGVPAMVIGPAAGTDGHIFKLQATWTKANATTYSVEGIFQDLTAGSAPVTNSNPALVPAVTFANASATRAFFNAIQAAAHPDYGSWDGVAIDTFEDVYTPAPPPPPPTVWKGNVDSSWNTSTPNWTLGVGGASTAYVNGVNVLFEDSGSGVVDLQDYTIEPKTMTFSNNSKAYTFGSSFYAGIQGITDLKKLGTGVVTIGATVANAYSGDTAIESGKLVSTVGAQNPNSAFKVASGATNGILVELPGNVCTIKSLDCAAGSTLEFNFGSVTASTTDAPLFADGTGANSLTAGATAVRILGGTGWTIGSTYPLLKYTGDFPGFGNLTLASLPPGVFGALTHNVGAKTISLAITPDTTIWNGNLSTVWDIGATANWKNSVGTSKTYADGAVVVLNDTAVGTGMVDLSVDVAPFSVTVDNTTKEYTLNGPGGITNGAFIKNGPGTVTVNNTNSYGGMATINQGVVKLGVAQALAGGTIQVTGGTLDLNGNNQSSGWLQMNNGTVTGAGELSLTGAPLLNGTNLIAGGTLTRGPNELLFNIDSGVTTVESVITEASAVVTDWGNVGVLVLSGSNTFTADTTIRDGDVVRIGNDQAFGIGGAVTLNHQATIMSADTTPHTISNPVFLGNGGGNGRMKWGLRDDVGHEGMITLAGPVTINHATANGEYEIALNENGAISGVISGQQITNRLVLYNPNNAEASSSTNRLILSGDNQFTGGFRAYWGRGRLGIGNNNAMGPGPCWFNNNTGLSSDSSTPRTIANNIRFGDNNGGMHIGDAVLNGPLTFAGALTLSANNDNPKVVNFQCYSDMIINGSLAKDPAATFPTGVRKSWPGTMTINSAAGYDGVTEVNGGKLLVNGSIGGAGVTINNNGILGGTGTVTPSVTNNAGGTLAAGASIGTLSLSGDLVLNGGNVLVEVNTSASPSNDLVVVAGSITNTGTSGVVVTNLGPALGLGAKLYPFGTGKTVANGAAMSVAGGLDAGLGWQNNLAVDGSIQVVVGVDPTLNWSVISPGVIQFDWTGSAKLVYQTNSLALGLGTNWMNWPDTSNPVSVTNDPAIPTTFFGLQQLP